MTNANESRTFLEMFDADGEPLGCASLIPAGQPSAGAWVAFRTETQYGAGTGVICGNRDRAAHYLATDEAPIGPQS